MLAKMCLLRVSRCQGKEAVVLDNILGLMEGARSHRIVFAGEIAPIISSDAIR